MKEIKVDFTSANTSENEEQSSIESPQIETRDRSIRKSIRHIKLQNKEKLDPAREEEINNQIFGIYKIERDFKIKGYFEGFGENSQTQETSVQENSFVSDSTSKELSEEHVKRRPGRESGSQKDLPTSDSARALEDSHSPDTKPKENCNTPNRSSIDLTNIDEITFSMLRDAISQYKKDTKCIYVGDFINQCSKIRKGNDRWYFWSREMIKGIDRNEEVMKRVLLSYGHSKVEELLEKHNSQDWNLSLEEKIGSFQDGLASMEEMICGSGMTTVWGLLKHNGTVFNRIREAFKKGNKIRGIIDYVRYKHRKWENHYKKVAEKIKKKQLYFS